MTIEMEKEEKELRNTDIKLCINNHQLKQTNISKYIIILGIYTGLSIC